MYLWLSQKEMMSSKHSSVARKQRFPAFRSDLTHALQPARLLCGCRARAPLLRTPCPQPFPSLAIARLATHLLHRRYRVSRSELTRGG